jgi:hypothetical protein
MAIPELAPKLPVIKYAIRNVLELPVILQVSVLTKLRDVVSVTLGPVIFLF